MFFELDNVQKWLRDESSFPLQSSENDEEVRCDASDLMSFGGCSYCQKLELVSKLDVITFSEAFNVD